MDSVVNWFAGLATIGGLLYFLAGFGFAYLTHYVRMRLRHRKIRLPWHLAGITIGVVAIIFTSLQSSAAYNTAKDVSLRSRECFREVVQQLTTRSKISEENDALSLEQRDLLTDYNHIQNQMWADLLDPPGDLANQPTDSPERQKYGLQVVQKALEESRQIEDKINAISQRQNYLVKQRAAHPLPPPTCGNP